MRKIRVTAVLLVHVF